MYSRSSRRDSTALLNCRSLCRCSRSGRWRSVNRASVLPNNHSVPMNSSANSRPSV